MKLTSILLPEQGEVAWYMLVSEKHKYDSFITEQKLQLLKSLYDANNKYI